MLFLLLVLVVILVEINVLGYAYERAGISRRYVFLVLFASLVGSYINIPIWQLSAEHLLSDRVVNFYGMQYVIPAVIDTPGTVIAVNLGGGVIPTLVSLYLVRKKRLYLEAVVATAVIGLVSFWLAHPVPGLGIAEPAFIPPLVTAVVVLIISRANAAPLAYIAGSLGTLIGADLLNLGAIAGLGAPVASIGGAGTYDGIFLTGIVAVLLASIFSPRPRQTA
jgi:uncharacterized membrane protein